VVLRRKRGRPAGGMWGEVVTGIMTSQSRCWLGVMAGRGVCRRVRSSRQ